MAIRVATVISQGEYAAYNVFDRWPPAAYLFRRLADQESNPGSTAVDLVYHNFNNNDSKYPF
jgi:hypothetical protein